MNDGPKLKPELDMTPALKLEILVNRDGMTTISGPLANKGLCYEMLVEAFFLVRQFKPGPQILAAKDLPQP